MKVTATFSNGQKISRNTSKELTHAYRSVTKYQIFTGFAGSEELARKAASYKSPSEIEIVLVGAE